MTNEARDVTTLSGDALFQALISDEPLVVDNRKHKKCRKQSDRRNPSPSSKTKFNGTALSSLEKLSLEEKLKRIVSGMPDATFRPVAVVLFMQDTTCLKCGSHFSAPYCEVPMLKIKKRKGDLTRTTAYVRLDTRIPAIHEKLPRYIQRKASFTHTCNNCFLNQEPLS